jgi:tetratricopeptide (TPR) repeat protein
MSRFDRLEFEPLSEKPRPEAKATPVIPEAEMTERDWLKRAIRERQQGQHEAALRLYSRALEWDKSLVAGWVGQVQMLIALNENPEAELWARKALELFKNNADLLAGRTQALTRLARYSEAQASSDLSLNQQGQTHYPWIARAELLLARKEKNEAYCFDKAMQLGGDWLTLLEIAAVYEKYGKLNQSLIRARQAVEKAPDQPQCWYCQGRYEAALGLKRPAELSLKRCRDLMPKHTEAKDLLREVQRGSTGGGGWFKRWFGG